MDWKLLAIPALAGAILATAAAGETVGNNHSEAVGSTRTEHAGAAREQVVGSDSGFNVGAARDLKVEGRGTTQAIGHDRTLEIGNTSSADKTAQADATPRIEVSHSPSEPGAVDQISFDARTGFGDVQYIELLVNAQVVKRCDRVASCSFRGGPYPPGTVTYAASARDRAGHQGFTGYKSLTVAPAGAGPRVSIVVVPAAPTDRSGITFTASAEDTGGIESIDIMVNGLLAHRCPRTTRCVFRGGPYAAGDSVNYAASALNRQGQTATTGYRGFRVAQHVACSIRGRVTGKPELIRGVGAYRSETSVKLGESVLDRQGNYSIDIPADDQVRVLLQTQRKVSPVSEPVFRDLPCRGGRRFTVDFLVKGIFEG